MGKEYILMNRQHPVLRFACERTAFDEPEFSELEWLTGLRPIGYRNLYDFLSGRQAPKHRKHIRQLLERYGCDDLERFLQVTHALSLNDTFWVREADSGLAWETVSLYRNEFDRLVSEAAFDGVISETDLSSTSPEFGTDGYYAKCWVRDDEGIWLYKSGSGLYVIEPVSEYLVSQLARRICPNAVDYDLAVYHDKLVSKCALFTSETTGLAKAGAVFRGEQIIPRLLDFCRALGCDDDFRRMCMLDALTLNPDRHYGNFGFLFENETMELTGFAPVFDNNRALFPELDEKQLASPDWYIDHCRPKLGRDFITTARGLLTEEIRTDLETLRDFHFSSHPQLPISESRLELLSSIVLRQLDKILA
ncbi:MAG: HipA protein [Oscillospiraceae bacterium]|nr:HipA protein [Oscillospiraceae bacterium]